MTTIERLSSAAPETRTELDPGLQNKLKVFLTTEGWSDRRLKVIQLKLLQFLKNLERPEIEQLFQNHEEVITLCGQCYADLLSRIDNNEPNRMWALLAIQACEEILCTMFRIKLNQVVAIPRLPGSDTEQNRWCNFPLPKGYKKIRTIHPPTRAKSKKPQ